MKKTILIDFDGVIHQYISKWTVPEEIHDDPVAGAFEAIEKYLSRFEVVIFSTRCKTQAGIKAMKDWFNKFGFDKTNELIFSYEKLPAVLLIDDRAIQFRGKFLTTEQIDNFIPWNK